MTSYKTIVRGLIKTYIVDHLNRAYTGHVDGVRVDALTISEDKCSFAVRAAVTNFVTVREFRIMGEVLPSGSVVIACVEV